MKKNIFYIMALALLTVGFTACEKQSAKQTKVTAYAAIELAGPAYEIIAINSPYTEPGYTATMDGKDVTDQVVITGAVDPTKSGIYTPTYSVTNPDGFVASTSRKVIVIDPANAIEGFWTNDPSSTRTYKGATVAFGSAFETLVIDNGDGTIYVDDLFGGWYSQGFDYGDTYNMNSVLSLDSDGTLELLGSYIPSWKDGADWVKDGKWDATAKTITYKMQYYHSMEFNITFNNKVDKGL